MYNTKRTNKKPNSTTERVSDLIYSVCVVLDECKLFHSKKSSVLNIRIQYCVPVQNENSFISMMNTEYTTISPSDFSPIHIFIQLTKFFFVFLFFYSILLINKQMQKSHETIQIEFISSSEQYDEISSSFVIKLTIFWWSIHSHILLFCNCVVQYSIHAKKNNIFF